MRGCRWMTIRMGILKEMSMDFTKIIGKFHDSRSFNKIVERHWGLSGEGIGQKVQHFISTENIISSSGLDLMQVSGYTIVAERLNFLRHCYHFRIVHRGNENNCGPKIITWPMGIFMSSPYSWWWTLWVAESFGFLKVFPWHTLNFYQAKIYKTWMINSYLWVLFHLVQVAKVEKGEVLQLAVTYLLSR